MSLRTKKIIAAIFIVVVSVAGPLAKAFAFTDPIIASSNSVANYYASSDVMVTHHWGIDTIWFNRAATADIAAAQGSQAGCSVLVAIPGPAGLFAAAACAMTGWWFIYKAQLAHNHNACISFVFIPAPSLFGALFAYPHEYVGAGGPAHNWAPWCPSSPLGTFAPFHTS